MLKGSHRRRNSTKKVRFHQNHSIVTQADQKYVDQHEIVVLNNEFEDSLTQKINQCKTISLDEVSMVCLNDIEYIQTKYENAQVPVLNDSVIATVIDNADDGERPQPPPANYGIYDADRGTHNLYAVTGLEFQSRGCYHYHGLSLSMM